MNKSQANRRHVAISKEFTCAAGYFPALEAGGVEQAETEPELGGKGVETLRLFPLKRLALLSRCHDSRLLLLLLLLQLLLLLLRGMLCLMPIAVA